MSQDLFNRITSPVPGQSIQLRIVSHLLHAHGLRWSEASRITTADISTIAEIHIHGTKRGYDRWIYDPHVVEYAKHLKAEGYTGPIITLSYSQVWRALSRDPQSSRRPGNRRRTVTHAGRYETAQRRAADRAAADEDVARSLGHRSNRAISYYMRGTPYAAPTIIP